MNPNSAVQQNDSGLQTDLSRYKQAAELAYRYAKDRADKQQPEEKESSSPFEEEKKETSNN